MLKKIHSCLLTCAVTACFGLSTAAYADSSAFIVPDWPTLIQMFVGFHALDFTNDDRLIDDYALIAHCDWYLAAHDDEFKWRQIRVGIVDTLQKNQANYVTNISYDTTLALGQYDFDAKYFRFAPNAGIENINAFLISNSFMRVCGKASVQYLPHQFRALLKVPVFVHGIGLSPEQGEALLKRMNTAENTQRTIYARFNLHITGIPRVMKSTRLVAGEEIVSYNQGELRNKDTAQMDAELVSIEFYEDQAMTQLLATYKP